MALFSVSGDACAVMDIYPVSSDRPKSGEEVFLPWNYPRGSAWRVGEKIEGKSPSRV